MNGQLLEKVSTNDQDSYETMFILFHNHIIIIINNHIPFWLKCRAMGSFIHYCEPINWAAS